MRTVADELQETADQLTEMLWTLLLEHSSLVQREPQRGSLVFLNSQGDYCYRELSETGRRIQAKLLEEYGRLAALLKVLLREQPSDSQIAFYEADTVVLQTIRQQATDCTSTREALDSAVAALMDELNLVRYLYDSSSDDVLYVPDTNALLYNPHLDRWGFDDASSFTLVMTPTVLAELDLLKVQHRAEAVRVKAESLISQMKEFRRRGRLTEGVTLVKGKSTVLAIAVEPKMDKSLPWLDSTNADDRFLAGVIEVMRLHSRHAVLAVSRDINLQNKLEFARIPFVEPPESVI